MIDAPTIMRVPLSEVEIPRQRQRAVVEDTIPRLARSIELIGLQHPIVVRRVGMARAARWEVVAGVRRVLAHRWLGRESILAVEDAGDGDAPEGELRQQLIELAENLERQDLTVLERAEHQERLEEILDELALLRGVGRPREGDPDHPLSTVEGRAAALGVSERTYQRGAQLVRRVPKITRDMLKTTPSANVRADLEALAREDDPDVQHAAAAQVVNGEAPNLRAALASLKPPPLPTPAQSQRAGEVIVWPDVVTPSRWRQTFRRDLEAAVTGALVTPVPVGEAFRLAADSMRDLEVELVAVPVVGLEPRAVWSGRRDLIIPEDIERADLLTEQLRATINTTTKERL